MAENEAITEGNLDIELNDSYGELESILSEVIKRRKTFPAKYMELNRRKIHFELLRLENANVISEENNQEQLKKIIEVCRSQDSVEFASDELTKVKERFEKCKKRNEEIRKYLYCKEKSKAV